MRYHLWTTLALAIVLHRAAAGPICCQQPPIIYPYPHRSSTASRGPPPTSTQAPAVPSCTAGATGDAACGTFEWATIGDSWDSGVAYAPEVAYDNNADKCLRLIDAYGAQMANDTTWTTGVQNFHFLGCSGSQLINMARLDGQIQKSGSPMAVVMTAGGNNAGFANVVKNCVYHPDPWMDYGPNYDNDTEATGACKQSLNNVASYLNDGDLANDLTVTIDDMLNTDQARSHNPFYLYITGYAHFWNVDTTDCNDWTFGIYNLYTERPPLTTGLRTQMNSLSSQFNAIYQNTIANYKPPANMNVRYVDITGGFEGHRFCEQGASFPDQYSNDDTYFWNLQYFTNIATPVTMPLGVNLNGTQGVDNSGITYMALPSIVDNTTAITPFLAGSPSDNATASSDPGLGDGNEISNGWRLRPFHPKTGGHTAIKNAVIAAMQGDRIPGVAPPSS